MQKIESHYDFNCPLESVWSLIVDFGGIKNWWPEGNAVHIESVELDGTGVGMTRHMHNRGFDMPVSERLDFLDMETHTYKLSIVDNMPAGLIQYQATGTLSRLDNDGCRLDYTAEFITEPGREEEARTFLLGAYSLMYQGLEGACTQ
ncbi:MAG: SRPBCC family protein [Spongiibacteraceae bacterium]